MFHYDAEVCNEALGHLGHGVEVVNVETDKDIGARTCRIFYRKALKIVTRAYLWPKHARTGALAMVDNPSKKWGYAYRQPNDCEFFRGIENSARIQTAENQIPWELSRDAVGVIILCDIPEAVGHWSVVIEDPNQWDSDFRLAYTRLLASLIAPKTTGGDQFKLGQQNYQLYQFQLDQAAARAFNERQADYTRTSGYLRSRR